MNLALGICLVAVAYMVGISLDALRIMFVPDPYSRKRRKRRRASQGSKNRTSQYKGRRARRVQQKPARRRVA